MKTYNKLGIMKHTTLGGKIWNSLNGRWAEDYENGKTKKKKNGTTDETERGIFTTTKNETRKA